MVELILGCIVMEGVELPRRHRHVKMYSDNTPTVTRKEKNEAGRILRALALQKHAHWTSPLATLHISGILNYLADIPSRSFGYNKNLNFKSDKDFLTFYNYYFPLIEQKNWQLF